LLAFLFDKTFLVDVVISHPSAPSHLSRAPLPLICNKYAESRKVSRYSGSIPPSFDFVPFALESFGAFGSIACEFMRKLDAASRDFLSSSLPPPPLAASLSVLLQKCNAFILSRGVVLLRSSSSSLFPFVH
jgi:hypothetical protein